MGEVTLKDVALRAGVSTAAASQALNDRGSLRADTRARIKEIAAELGYIPHAHAAALRRGRTMSIGYVVPDRHEHDAEDRWAIGYARQLTALVRASAEWGFTVTVIPADRADLVRSTRLDAVYAADPRASDPVLGEALRLGIPVVANDLALPEAAGVEIRTGYEDAARAGLELLARAGAARVGLLTKHRGRPSDEVGEDVYRRWCAATGRQPVVVRAGGDRDDLADALRALASAGVDAIYSYLEQGPEVYLQLERTDLVIPRDLQLVALCVHDCGLNERLGVTRTCVHPEQAPALMIEPLAALLAAYPAHAVVSLPWELQSGSTTRL
ncbi:LacI family DNA-binding transcriptional regulator [Microbacterium sp. X-17]|uniref:LacI family DNA-binding transcriptional regulator n=1 Tax=Microbacterium sp. X-17 TaxID=3144404 RepID=UPI0031F5B709